jgi:hypothetical protein
VLEKEKAERDALARKLEDLESKVIVGGENLVGIDSTQYLMR